MTLFESLVSLVILGLVAAGFLGAFQTTSRSTRSAGEWMQAVSYAESSMEETKLGALVTDPLPDTLPGGYVRGIEIQPFPQVPGVAQVTVTVLMPGGGRFVLDRLVRSQ